MWNGEKQDNFDIYIKQIGSESLRRLTTDPRDDFDPAWSPDGQSIAFMRDLEADKTAVMVIPSNGGRERQVAELKVVLIRGCAGILAESGWQLPVNRILRMPLLQYTSFLRRQVKDDN